jgi:hypothetical protein
LVRLAAEWRVIGQRVREAEGKRCQLMCSMLVWLLVKKRKRHFPLRTQLAKSLGIGLKSRKMHKNIFFSPGSRATSSCNGTIIYLTHVGREVHLMGLGYCSELSVP